MVDFRYDGVMLAGYLNFKLSAWPRRGFQHRVLFASLLHAGIWNIYLLNIRWDRMFITC